MELYIYFCIELSHIVFVLLDVLLSIYPCLRITLFQIFVHNFNVPTNFSKPIVIMTYSLQF